MDKQPKQPKQLLKDSQILSHSFNSNGICLYEVKWGNDDITWETLDVAQRLTSFVDYPYRPHKKMFPIHDVFTIDDVCYYLVK